MATLDPELKILAPVRDQAMRLDPHPLKSDLAAHLSMLQELRLRENDFDVIHFHVDLIHFPFFEALAYKTVTTRDVRCQRLTGSGPSSTGCPTTCSAA